jgi:hypothetical protein
MKWRMTRALFGRVRDKLMNNSTPSLCTFSRAPSWMYSRCQGVEGGCFVGNTLFARNIVKMKDVYGENFPYPS